MTPALALSLQRGARITAWPVTPARLRRWVRLALARNAMLTLRLVARAEAIALNQAYRGRDYAPNVLTFAYGTPAEPPDERAPDAPAAADDTAVLQADIVICLPVVRAQARAQRKPFEHHLAHMVVHGVLHAQGHDHLEPAQAATMEALETRLLARLRVPDPYVARAGKPAAHRVSSVGRNPVPSR